MPCHDPRPSSSPPPFLAIFAYAFFFHFHNLESLILTEGLLLLDNNNLVGDVDIGICDLEQLQVFSSDCVEELNCPCCTICCSDSDPTCNSLDWKSNLDPVWESNYERVQYFFGQEQLDSLP